MGKTLKFGSRAVSSSITERMDRHVMRRRTPSSYGRLQELAAADYARHVAWEVTPQLNRNRPLCTFAQSAPPFGKREPSR